MKTKLSNAAKIRAALAAGDKPKNISERLKVPISTVYTINWKMKNRDKKPKQRIIITKNQTKPTPMADFIRAELSNVEAQISRLSTIASFLAVRLRQLEQNGE